MKFKLVLNKRNFYKLNTPDLTEFTVELKFLFRNHFYRISFVKPLVFKVAYSSFVRFSDAKENN